MKDKKYLYWGITAVFVIAAAFVLYYMIFHLDQVKTSLGKIISILMPLIDGFILAYILCPILNFFEGKMFVPMYLKTKRGLNDRRKKRMRIYSIILTYIVFVAAVFGFGVLVVNSLASSISDIIDKSDIYVNNLTTWVNGFLENNVQLKGVITKAVDNYSDSINEFVKKNVLPSVTGVGTKLYEGLFGTIKALWNFIFGLIISIYLLGSKEKFFAQFRKIIYANMKLENANRFSSNVRFVHSTFGGYLAGKIVDSFIVGCICYIGCVFMNDPYCALIAVIVGVTNVIPCFGPIIGAIPSTLIILMVNPLKALYFVIFIIVLQQFDGNLIGPKILGDKTGLSSFWVLFAIVFFGGTMGLLGMIIGVPLFAVLFAAFKSWIEKKLTKRGLPFGTGKYLHLLYIDVDNFVYEPEPQLVKKEKKSKKKNKAE